MLETVAVDDPIQVIKLVLQDAGHPPRDAQLILLTLEIASPHERLLRTAQRIPLARERETTLDFAVFIELKQRFRFGWGKPEHWVDSDITPALTSRLLLVGVHKQSLADAHLRTGEANAWSRIHGVVHVSNQFANAVVNVTDRLCNVVQDRIAVNADGKNGHVLRLAGDLASAARGRARLHGGFGAQLGNRTRIILDVPNFVSVLSEGVLGLTPTQMLGIPLALLGAVFMSLGAKYQHQGVAKVGVNSDDASDGAQGLGGSHLLALVARPSWLIGTAMLGLAIALQLASLAFSPLIVVQPLGVVSLVLTTILSARDTGRRLSRSRITAVTLCVVGVSVFVTIAALSSRERIITNLRIEIVIILLAAAVAVFGIAFVALRKRFKALFYIVCAGVLYGFVATLAKITINRIQNGAFDWLTILVVVMLIIGTAVGAYFVQIAYASGPPDMVVAGLTVIDPLVAVVIGIVVLGETDGAPWSSYLGFSLAGLVAIAGVFLLERGQSEDDVQASKQAALRSRGTPTAGDAASSTSR